MDDLPKVAIMDCSCSVVVVVVVYDGENPRVLFLCCAALLCWVT